jgi:hypothetical protein
MRYIIPAVLALDLGLVLGASAISHRPMIVSDNASVQTDAVATTASSDPTVIIGSSMDAQDATTLANTPSLSNLKADRSPQPPVSVPNNSRTILLISIGMLGIQVLPRKLG